MVGTLLPGAVSWYPDWTCAVCAASGDLDGDAAISFDPAAPNHYREDDRSEGTPLCLLNPAVAWWMSCAEACRRLLRIT
jgi:hypothetical protein